jgi:FkbM family methyltransferase
MKLLKKFWENSPKKNLTLVTERFSKKNKNNPVWIEVEGGPLKGSELFLDVNSFKGWDAMISGNFDFFIVEKLKEFKNISTCSFWDIGAHFGYHTLSFATLISNNYKVYAFEPNPFNAERLQKNLGRNKDLAKKVILNQIALSDSDGKATFEFSDEVDHSESSGSHLAGVQPPLSENSYLNFKELVVATRKIDSLILENTIEPAQVVKIDVEGAEMLVLEGGKSFFSKYKPLIFMEVHNITMMFEVFNFLSSIGYKLEMIDKESSTTSWCYIFASPTATEIMPE